MTDGLLWGGINIRKYCRFLLGNFWMIIAAMIITYLGLGLVDKQTYTPSYTSAAVVAVYPMSSPYRFHTIETVSNLSSKTGEISSVFNSAMFQSGFHNQDPSLEDCTIESIPVANTDLLVMHATSSNQEKAYKGIQAALEYYSQFSGDMTGAPEIKVILGPVAPSSAAAGSKIQKYQLHLCLFSGLIMAGLLSFIYLARKTFKTERSIRSRYKNVRFFSVPVIRSGLKNKKGILLKKNRQEPIKKVAVEIKQALHKYKKNTLLVTSCADKAGGTAFSTALARELAEQNEKVILIEMDACQHDSVPEADASDDMAKYSLLDVLQQKCTVKDAMFYRKELKVHCIQCASDSIDADVSYSIDDVRRVLTECLAHASIILVNAAAWYPSYDAQIWHEAADASVALCVQEDADFFKVDKMLSDLQKGNTYFAGCVLFGF